MEQQPSSDEVSAGVYRALRILVFADDAAAGLTGRRAAESVGARVGEVIPIAEGSQRLDRQSALDGIVVEILSDHGAVLDRLLARVAHLANRDQVAVAVTCPFDLLDRVEAHFADSPAAVLPDADEADRVAALALGLQDRSPLLLRDSAREIDAVRLRRLADEVSRIARSLSNLSANSPSRSQGLAGALQAELRESGGGFAAEPAGLGSPPLPPADLIRKTIRMRRMRESFFDTALFADPAWDMLLDLFAARIEDEDVAVSSLCIAAAVPPTTALRWIKTMTDHGLFERHADPQDGRRIYVRLADAATARMADYFATLRRFEGVAI